MAFFNDLTTSLKQKWLQFFQVNRSWIARHMEVQSVYTPDGGRRPPSYLILGVANALEPQLAELMLPFSKLNPDVDALLDALELNFDPDLLLGNRFNLAANPEELRNESSEMSDEEVAPMLQEPIYNVTVVETLTEVEPHTLSGMSLNETDSQVVLVESDDESIVVLNVAEPDMSSGMSLNDIDSQVVLVKSDDDESIVVLNVAEPDMLLGMSLDDTANDQVVLVESDDESIGVMTVDELDELSNMLLDDTDSEVVLVESDDASLETASAVQLDTFGDMSLDEMADFTTPLESDDESLKTPSAAGPDEFDNVLSDIWGEEKLGDSDRADEKQSEREQEISRLFPNL